MSNTTRSALRFVLGGLAWCFFSIAAISFMWGGGLYARLTRSDRLLDEMGGWALAAVFGLLGGVAKIAQQRLEVAEDEADKAL